MAISPSAVIEPGVDAILSQRQSLARGCRARSGMPDKRGSVVAV